MSRPSASRSAVIDAPYGYALRTRRPGIAKRFAARKRIFDSIFRARTVVLVGEHSQQEDFPMQRVTLVRYTTKPGHADENEKLARSVFGELRSSQPDGLAYGLFRDGNEFIHVFLNMKEDDA